MYGQKVQIGVSMELFEQIFGYEREHVVLGSVDLVVGEQIIGIGVLRVSFLQLDVRFHTSVESILGRWILRHHQ